MSPVSSAPTATTSTVPKECQCSASPLSPAALSHVLRMAVARALTPAECAFVCNPSPPSNQESVLVISPSHKRRVQRMSHNRARPGAALPDLKLHLIEDALSSSQETSLLPSKPSSTPSLIASEPTMLTLLLTSIEVDSTHHVQPEQNPLPTPIDLLSPPLDMSLDLIPQDSNLLIPPLDPALFQPSGANSDLSDSAHNAASATDMPSSPTNSPLSTFDLLIPSPIPPPSAPSMTSLPAADPQQDTPSLIPLSCPFQILGILALLFIFAVLVVELIDTVRGFMGVSNRRKGMMSSTRCNPSEKGKDVSKGWVRVRSREVRGEKGNLEAGRGSESEGLEDGELVRFGAWKKVEDERAVGWC